jgi:virginiamycin B lyase
MRIGITIAVLLLIWFGAWTAPSAEVVEITEWTVPWENTRPRDPYVDARNRVWFVGQVGDYVAYLDPRNGQFKRFDLEPGTGPHNLVVDEKQQVWYAANLKGYIGRLDPSDGRITRFPTTRAEARDPHTLVFDLKGDIWFTLQRGNSVGKLSTSTGEIQLISVPTPGARPYGVVVDGRNQPWIAEFGTNKLATLDSRTMKFQEFPLPRKAARPRRLALTSDGNIWYVDYAQGVLGRFNTTTHSIQEWPAPGGDSSMPYGMVSDDRGRLWFVECGPQPNRFVGFDPDTQKFFSVTEIRSGGGSVRHMFFHPASREIWFGTDKNTIGRARIP